MYIRRVVVVGAGAMGCFFAARLAESGCDVRLVDVDDARLQTINTSGVTINDDQGTSTVHVSASRASQVSGPTDLIILFTKGAHTGAAIASVSHLVGSTTLALTLQNGVGNAEAIAAIVPAERILMGITDIPCDLVGANSVSSHGHGHIALGAFCNDDHANGIAVAALLANAALDVTHDPAIQIQVWEKIAFNAAMNAFCTITTLPVGGLDNEPGRRVIGAIIAEVIAVAQASGIAVDPALISAKIDNALASHVDHKPSMLQDRLAGRQTEIETINGAVVRAGEALGVGVTANRIFADVVRTIEAATRGN